jgi:hypothetical protein
MNTQATEFNEKPAKKPNASPSSKKKDDPDCGLEANKPKPQVVHEIYFRDEKEFLCKKHYVSHLMMYQDMNRTLKHTRVTSSGEQSDNFKRILGIKVQKCQAKLPYKSTSFNNMQFELLANVQYKDIFLTTWEPVRNLMLYSGISKKILNTILEMKDDDQLQYCHKFMYKLAFFHEYLRSGPPMDIQDWDSKMDKFDKLLFGYFKLLRMKLLSGIALDGDFHAF